MSNYKFSSHNYFIVIGIHLSALYFTYLPYINNTTMFVAHGGSLGASDSFDNWLRISYLFTSAILIAVTIFDLPAQIKKDKEVQNHSNDKGDTIDYKKATYNPENKLIHNKDKFNVKKQNNFFE